VFVQLGSILSANIYKPKDAPLYRKGNRNLFAINILVLALFVFAKLYYVTKNKIRDRKWNALSAEVCLDSLVFLDPHPDVDYSKKRIIRLILLIRLADVWISDSLTSSFF
jgi:hypothetical protein